MKEDFSFPVNFSIHNIQINKRSSINFIQAICSGIIDKTDSQMFHSYTQIFAYLIVVVMVLMVAVNIGKNQISLEPISSKFEPKNLESMLLNLTLLVLIFSSYVFKSFLEK